MSLQGHCPTCGAPIAFGMANSLVTICDSCHTIAGRGDGSLENYGQVADLAQTDSPLQVGLSGEVKGVPFVVTGRAQYKHSAGGVWDEWYVAFRDGKRWGWLAEAQGKYYLTFPKELPSDFAFDFAGTPLETEVAIPDNGTMKVVEIGEATAISAEGEIPYEFRVGETAVYADLQGSNGRFATLDNSESPPTLYLGGEFSLERLGIDPHAASREDDEAAAVGAIGISCPNCGGTLEQHCPESLRIVCSYCDSLIDVSEGQGSLKFLEKLGKQKIKPVIPLGSKGTLRGREYQVIGFMRRKVRDGGVDYPWQEYLLYTPRQGFHWLIHSESHWSLGKPVSAGAVKIRGPSCTYDSKTFRLFDRSVPIVTHVLGEFYWEVSKGERTHSKDFIHPPWMLSREESRGGSDAANAAAAMADLPPIVNPQQPADGQLQAGSQNREVNYTVSEYLTTAEVEQAFGVKGLRKPHTVAPNQPYPHKGIYPMALMFYAVTVALAIFFFVTGSSKVVYQERFNLLPQSASAEAAPAGVGSTGSTGDTLVFFPSAPVEIKGGRNIQVTLEANVDNSWVYVAGDFFDEERGSTYPFEAEAAYYHGSSGGESWSEGGRRKRRYVSALPSGKYSLRLEFQWDRARQPTVVANVTVRQGVPRILNLFLTLLALSLAPIAVAIHHVVFEGMRWSQSDFAGGD